jgi:hypothetical protein
VLCRAAHLSKSSAGVSFGGRCAETLWLAIEANGLAMFPVSLLFGFFSSASFQSRESGKSRNVWLYIGEGSKKRGHEQSYCE